MFWHPEAVGMRRLSSSFFRNQWDLDKVWKDLPCFHVPSLFLVSFFVDLHFFFKQIVLGAASAWAFYRPAAEWNLFVLKGFVNEVCLSLTLVIKTKHNLLLKLDQNGIVKPHNSILCSQWTTVFWEVLLYYCPGWSWSSRAQGIPLPKPSEWLGPQILCRLQ